MGEIRLSRNATIVSKLVKSISISLRTNKAISELRLVGLKIGNLGWIALGEGLSHGCPIEFFAVNYCKMDDNALEKVAPGLRQLERLRKLDLSNNQLADRCGFILSRLISVHSFRKDEISWLNNLRNESTPSDLLFGLQELCLANNKLPDHAIFDLCHALSFDSWIHALDLRRNPISEDGCKEIASMVESNCSLLALDIRETGLRDETVRRAIAAKLRRNLKATKPRLTARRYEEYAGKIKESEGDVRQESCVGHGESESFPNVELTHEIQAEDMLGSYLSDSPKQVKAMERSVGCSQCRTMERQLLRSESQCVALKIANRSLRSSMKSRVSTAHASDEHDTRIRIESLMLELTQLIEHLEES